MTEKLAERVKFLLVLGVLGGENHNFRYAESCQTGL